MTDRPMTAPTDAQMRAIAEGATERLPKAVDGCRCVCHRQKGVWHFIPCCGPGSFRNRTEGGQDGR